MTQEEIAEHMAGMSNEQLRAAADEANRDLKDAFEKEPNSEWHAACFAALYMYCSEMSRRGMANETVH